ncbi:hypothetical protein ASPCAL07657 [Aspergillus calidoustus]|uniref:Uncharacterized protein n=1 Tax=Aspergillus calidoustus TaxID=454130 RepID=A0A0U5GRA9_ASPCI|nr:hypothetical protein ASPCAL07657 [Aspergillus calidoustus]
MLRTGFRVLMDGKRAPLHLFATSSKDVVLNPGLEIPGLGPVGVPISPLVADAIAKLCHGTSLAGGSLSQETAPRACVLNAGQFRLRNPRWDVQARLLKDVLLKNVLDDESRPNVDIQLDNCMLITPGSSFVPDQRQQPPESVFGTMAICLPSEHKGGDIVVSYRGKSQIFSPSIIGSDTYAFSLAAWSAFAKPVGTPVTSGYQLILTYKLVHRPTFMSLHYQHEGAATSLTDLLSSWANWAEGETTSFQTEGVPPKLWFSRALESTSGPRLPALFHQLQDWYPTADLGFDALIDQDKRQVTKLRMACH